MYNILYCIVPESGRIVGIGSSHELLHLFTNGNGGAVSLRILQTRFEDKIFASAIHARNV